MFLYSLSTAELVDLIHGFPTYADVDGNGVEDPDADKKYVDADALINVNAGLSLNMTYKNWDFSFISQVNSDSMYTTVQQTLTLQKRIL